jgi:CheY-like chemotaxis protein
LGLTITKQFIEMMGGSIHINSKLGSGCTFSVDLPAQIDTTQIKDSSETQPSDLSKEENIILIIDDDAVMCHLLKDDLTKLGYVVVIAANGDEGMDLAYKLHPKTILLNVQMSGMEGWRVLSALKNDLFFALIRVILIVMDADTNQWYAMDATECLDKSAVRTQLAVFLEKYLVDDDSEDSIGSIMVIEDDIIWRSTMTHLLENQGWRVLQAENGQAALEELKNQKFNEQPKLILLDLNMPVMDGFEFITHLMNDEKCCSIPVVVLTSRNLSAEEQVHLNQSVKFILQKETYAKNELAQHIHQMIAKALNKNCG